MLSAIASMNWAAHSKFIQSRKFTRFELLIPFTIAVIPALLVRSGSLTLAVPSSRIDCFLMIRKNDMHYTQGKPVVVYDNSTIYIEKLDALLQNRTDFEFAEEFRCLSLNIRNGASPGMSMSCLNKNRSC